MQVCRDDELFRWLVLVQLRDRENRAAVSYSPYTLERRSARLSVKWCLVRILCLQNRFVLSKFFFPPFCVFWLFIFVGVFWFVWCGSFVCFFYIVFLRLSFAQSVPLSGKPLATKCLYPLLSLLPSPCWKASWPTPQVENHHSPHFRAFLLLGGAHLLHFRLVDTGEKLSVSPGCVLQLRAMKDISWELVVAGITCSFVNKTEHVLSTSTLLSHRFCVDLTLHMYHLLCWSDAFPFVYFWLCDFNKIGENREEITHSPES